MRVIWSFAALIVATLAVANATMASSAAHGESAHKQKVCGWFVNPTPQNVWMDTASTEWIISIQGPYQGGYEAKGDWAWPQFRAGQWVHTNGGDYGYGCACLHGVLNDATKRVVRVYSIKARSLQTCRQNPALRAKEPPNPAA